VPRSGRVAPDRSRQCPRAYRATRGSHHWDSVVPTFWGQGFGTELAGLLVEFATGTVGAREVRATTLDGNPASTRVLEKLGFAAVEVGASEVDSRGDERRVTRWSLLRRSA